MSSIIKLAKTKIKVPISAAIIIFAPIAFLSMIAE
jgi:hypothetical protein